MSAPKSNLGLVSSVACSLLATAAWAQQQGNITTGGNSNRPIFVQGKVELDGGGALPRKVQIELVCQAQGQPQGTTDSEGNFNVQLGTNRFEGAGDASMGSAAAGSGFGGALRGQPQVDGASVQALAGCFLRAVLQGYRSDSADVGRVRLGDSLNVGTIFLHKVGEVQGTAVSATSLAAPKDAKKALDKAREQIAAQKLPDAEKQLRQAVRLYPKYAEAWHELGAVLQAQNNGAEARKAYAEALACDANFVKPYVNLARLSAVEKKWQDVLDQTGTLLRLNPYEYPQGHYYRAVAQYNLNNFNEAFGSAQQAVKLDTAHTVPLAEQLLGVLYSMRGDHQSAAQQFRNYMQHVPPGTNVSAVQAMLAEAEKALAAAPSK